MTDQSLVFSAYLGRANVYRHLALKWGDKNSFANGLKALALAKADYEKARAIAQKDNYATKVRVMEDSLRDIESFRKDFETQRRRIEEIARNPICSPKKPRETFS